MGTQEFSMLRFLVPFWGGIVLASGCNLESADLQDADVTRPVNAQTGKPLLEVGPSYRSVGYEYFGPSTGGLSTSFEVWDAANDWADVTTEAGLAWGANSGLTWDQKYSVWVDGLGSTTADDGHTTVELTTPWGRAIASPSLECAEMAMFLRITFAAWHELPFFISAWSSTYGSVHMGHFGIVDSNGDRLTGYPYFKTQYEDYNDDLAAETDAYILANWPSDPDLVDKYLTSSKDDEVAFLGTDAYAGAYFDEIFLNKRVGHLLLKLLVNYGSMHLASSKNTWNLMPEDMREGDLLIHRWQSQGIGHAMIIKEVDNHSSGQLDAEIIYGSMPRIQPVWYNAAISKSYFVSDYAGSGEIDTATGDAYSQWGGGLKRWRTPTEDNGHWLNIVPVADQGSWIGSTDYTALEGRIATSESIMGMLTPEEERDAAIERIRMARENLEQRPASCTNREHRADAFDDLYAIQLNDFGMTAEQVDAEYRVFADYVFAPLEYTVSKTCCWNSTTPEMYDIIMQYNTELVEDAHTNNQCAEPVVFKARDFGTYDPFESYAASIGRSADWVAWSEDESCPQRDVDEDTEATTPWTDFCDIYVDMMGLNACPNNTPEEVFYRDADGDGYGDVADTIEACTVPSGYVTDTTDCDDSDDSANPNEAELCDSVDNDCDGDIDEGCTSSNGGNNTNGGNTNGGSSSSGPGCGCSGATAVGGPLGAGVLAGSLGLAIAGRRMW
jgi:hypothetical protein